MIIANFVVYNEQDRYFDACLTWLRELDLVDEIFVTDDRSTDATVDVALHHGARCYIREEEEPSFLEAEGSFRQLGWQQMISRLQPSEDDWIIGLDADQFLMRIPERLPECGIVEAAIHEVFLMNPVSVRVDGFWGGIVSRCMAAFREGDQSFRTTGMPCGLFPSYAEKGTVEPADKMEILHFGYATSNDRQEKYNRYTAVKNNHSKSHIQSILQPPRLLLWEGPAPTVWRGYA